MPMWPHCYVTNAIFCIKSANTHIHTHTHLHTCFSLSMNRKTKTMYNVYIGLSSKFVTVVEIQCISVNISQMFIQHQTFSYRDLGVIHQHVETELRIASVDWVSIGSCPMVGVKLHHCQLYTPGPQISQIVTAFTWQQTPFSTNQNTGVRFTNHFPALTHWARDEMNNISQTTFSKVFSSIKMFEFRLKFHWNLFPMVQLTIFQHWFR